MCCGRVITKAEAVRDKITKMGSQEWIVRAGPGVANQRIGPGTRLRIVDAILTGVHERGTSHYELLRAFADDDTLVAADQEIDAHGYRHHEFGDSLLVFPPGPVGRA